MDSRCDWNPSGSIADTLFLKRLSLPRFGSSACGPQPHPVAGGEGMIRKFVTVPGLMVVMGATALLAIVAGTPTARAQQASAQQASGQPSQAQPSQDQPSQAQQDNQQAGSQEAPEETTSRRRAKPRDFNNWLFNVGGGASLTNGTTRAFARGGGGAGAAGAARNYSKYFGFRADVQWDDLPLRNSAFILAQAPGGNDHVYSIMLDPIVTLPATKEWSGYVLIGPSFYHRTGKLDSSAAQPGTPCNPFWLWWGACHSNNLRQDGRFLRSNVNQFGENFGAGIAYKIRPKLEIYGEFRYLHGSSYRNTTDLRPVTIGVRF